MKGDILHYRGTHSGVQSLSEAVNQTGEAGEKRAEAESIGY